MKIWEKNAPKDGSKFHQNFSWKKGLQRGHFCRQIVELKLSSFTRLSVDRMAAWHSECDHQLTDVESAQHSQRAVRSSPHTGRELSGGEVAHRMLTDRGKSPSYKKTNFYLLKFSLIVFLFLLWFGPTSRVSPDARGWSLYLTQLGGFVWWRRPVYIVVNTIYSRFNPLNSKGFLLRIESPILKKNLFKRWKYFQRKIFLFFIRKIQRVEPGRAYTHMHRFADVRWVSVADATE